MKIFYFSSGMVMLLQIAPLFSMDAHLIDEAVMAQKRIDDKENEEGKAAQKYNLRSCNKRKEASPDKQITCGFTQKKENARELKQNNRKKQCISGQSKGINFSALFYFLRDAQARQNHDLVESLTKALHDALYNAALEGSEETVTYIINQGADVNGTSYEGKTPLMGAIIGGHMRIAEFLLARGANANMVDKKGIHPLEVAALHVRMGIAGLLLRYGAQSPLRFLKF